MTKRITNEKIERELKKRVVAEGKTSAARKAKADWFASHVTIIGLDDPAELHNTIKNAVEE